jgi:putative Mg2+ transporter-C (MgtC) family protein
MAGRPASERNCSSRYGQPGVSEAIRLDPARIAYGVMVGIGFLGAGAVIKDGTSVRGLTTAASLWCTAAIGLACGFGMFLIAIGATVLVLAALVVLGAVESRVVTRRRKDVIVVIDPTPERNSITIIQETLASHGVKTFDIGYARDLDTGLETVTLSVTVPADRNLDEMAYWLKELPKVKKITVR